MAAKVDIISKEMIKPSVSTPTILKTHKLSLLDQTEPLVFIPLIFSYHYEPLDNITGHGKIIQLLKQSLSDALSRFYPLAGRLEGNSCIDCSDAGVEFIEAQVHDPLSQVLGNSKVEELGVLLPADVLVMETKDVLLSIQVNLFNCGGIAIGVYMSHKIGDVSSLVTFMNAWACIARRDDKNVVQPNFNLLSDLSPSMELLNSKSPQLAPINEEILVRRFIFNKEKLDVLKKLAASGSQVKDPTCVEALSSFIWKHFMENSMSKKHAAAHAVNLRPRMNPTSSDHSFGNLVVPALAILPNQESEMGSTSNDLVYQLRNSIRKVDDSIKMLQNIGEESLKNWSLAVKGEFEVCTFTSWRRFPIYEVDFGWGKPIRVCTTTLACKNLIILIDTKCGKGIEAYVNMLEENGFSEALSQFTSP